MCERAPAYARLKSLKVSSQSCSQQEELRKRRWKRGSKGSIIWRLRHCYRLFQGKVDVFNFEKPPGLLHMRLETSCLVRSALCSRTLPRSKIDSRHILQTPELLPGHTWNTPARAEAQTQRRAPPVAEQSQRRSHVWGNLEANLCNKCT